MAQNRGGGGWCGAFSHSGGGELSTLEVMDKHAGLLGLGDLEVLECHICTLLAVGAVHPSTWQRS